MDVRQLEAYSVQSSKHPQKWHEVILGTSATPHRTKCTCGHYVHHGQICEHIEKALGLRALDL